MAIYKLFSKILLIQTYLTTCVSFSCEFNSKSTQENKHSLKAGMFFFLKAGMGDSKRPTQHLRLALGLECRCSIL